MLRPTTITSKHSTFHNTFIHSSKKNNSLNSILIPKNIHNNSNYRINNISFRFYGTKQQYQQKFNHKQEKRWVWGNNKRFYSQENNDENEELRNKAKAILNASEIKKRDMLKSGPYTTQKSTNYVTGLMLCLLAFFISFGVIGITFVQNEKSRKKRRDKEEKMLEELR